MTSKDTSSGEPKLLSRGSKNTESFQRTVFRKASDFVTVKTDLNYVINFLSRDLVSLLEFAYISLDDSKIKVSSEAVLIYF